MKELFNDLFEYHHHFNQLLNNELETHSALLPQRSMPLFCHVLNAFHIWNARVLGFASPGVHDIHSFDECRQINDAILDHVRIILDQHELDKIIDYRNSSGRIFSNSIRDILLHSANHATHHKGQIISDFRQAGITPLVTDYIFYRRNKASGQ